MGYPIEWYYDEDSGTTIQITVELCRERVAQLSAQMDEFAILPDGMGTGRRRVDIGRARSALLAQMAVWNARLYRYSGGSEGSPPGLRLEHV